MRFSKVPFSFGARSLANEVAIVFGTQDILKISSFFRSDPLIRT